MRLWWHILLVGIGIALAFACKPAPSDVAPAPTTPATPATPPPAQPSPTALLKGVSLSPRSFQGADFTSFFAEAKEAGTIVAWAGNWQELGMEKGGPTVVAELSKTYGYTPVIEAQFFTQSTGTLLRPLDEAARQAYTAAAAAFSEKYRPKYLGLGIEVNILYEKSPADFETFVEFFGEVYDAVKGKSPSTKIFPTFQLERMKGLHGGIFGGRNDPAQAQWALLDRFPKADLAAFTTYPGLVFLDPSEIPVDYYAEIRAHTSKPVAFTEIGWHSAASPVGWESSEAEQAEFVARFYALTQGVAPELAIWSFLYDPKTVEPFNSMGLRRPDGTARPAWEAWITSK